MEFRSDMERNAWAKVRALPEFDQTAMIRMGVSRNAAGTFTRRWIQAGYTRVLRKDGHRIIYVNAALPVAPDAAARVADTAEGAMWTVIRRRGAFVPSDIVLTVQASGREITERAVKTYCRALTTAGFLRVRQTAVPGKREAAFQLINDTGPLAPRVASVRGVVDANTKTFTPLGDLS